VHWTVPYLFISLLHTAVHWAVPYLFISLFHTAVHWAQCLTCLFLSFIQPCTGHSALPAYFSPSYSRALDSACPASPSCRRKTFRCWSLLDLADWMKPASNVFFKILN
jgi:hypothetical protein